MKFKFALCVLLVASSRLSFAQFTNVTGTVVDPNGVPYANGTISPVLVLPGGASPTLNGLPYSPPTQPVGLDQNGRFSFNIADNNLLQPAATKWNFTVCSAKGTVNPAVGTGSQCFSLAAPITITGASQSISANLNAAARALTVPIGGGGVPFGNIGSGTNTTAAMVVGPGASVLPSGTGQIAASSAYFPAAAQTAPGGAVSLCPTVSFFQNSWIQRADSSWAAQSGIDVSDTTGTLPPPFGSFYFCNRVFISDSGQNIHDQTQQGGGPIRNALFSVSHKSGRATDSGAGIDERAIAYRFTDGDVTATYNQFLGLYGETFIYNNNFLCGGSIGGITGENCAAAMRVRINDERTAGVNQVDLVGVDATATSNGVGSNLGGCTYCVIGVQGNATNGINSINGNGKVWVGVAGGTNNVGSLTNASSAAVLAVGGSGFVNRFPSGNDGLVSLNFGNNIADLNLDSLGADGDSSSGKNFFGGRVYFPELYATGTTINVEGSLGPQGILTHQVTSATVWNSVSNVGTAGATSYSYRVTCVDAAGGEMPGTNTLTTATGNATLDGTNFNRLAANSATSKPQGCSTYNIYRTASAGNPASIGLIGTVSGVIRGSYPRSTMYGTTLTFDDTGLAAQGTFPSANTSGQIKAAGIIQGTNTVRLASDQTLNADTNLHTITGLVWNLDASARNYSFHCWIQYSQATAGAANNIGIQSATQAATNIAANGVAQTNTTAFTAGPGVTALASTTATNVITFTPGATATVFTITMDGTIEQPVGGNVINIMASTGNAADALTIKRGSYCTLNP
jgi:hypothetical protein